MNHLIDALVAYILQYELDSKVIICLVGLNKTFARVIRNPRYGCLKSLTLLFGPNEAVSEYPIEEFEIRFSMGNQNVLVNSTGPLNIFKLMNPNAENMTKDVPVHASVPSGFVWMSKQMRVEVAGCKWFTVDGFSDVLKNAVHLGASGVTPVLEEDEYLWFSDLPIVYDVEYLSVSQKMIKYFPQSSVPRLRQISYLIDEQSHPNDLSEFPFEWAADFVEKLDIVDGAGIEYMGVDELTALQDRIAKFPNLKNLVFETHQITIPDTNFFFRLPPVENLTIHAGIWEDCEMEKSEQQWKHLTIQFEGVDESSNIHDLSLETTKELFLNSIFYTFEAACRAPKLETIHLKMQSDNMLALFKAMEELPSFLLDQKREEGLPPIKTVLIGVNLYGLMPPCEAKTNVWNIIKAVLEGLFSQPPVFKEAEVKIWEDCY